MPFTITFHNWRGIKAFDQMKPTAASKQFGISYQPVLLSWEQWTPINRGQEKQVAEIRRQEHAGGGRPGNQE